MSKTNPYSFKDLIVWQKAMVLAKLVYLVCANLPRSEIYGIQSQLKRSAVTVPSNIAEGKLRSGKREYRYFLHVAKGSLAELQTQLILAADLFGVSTEMEQGLCIEIDKILFTLIRNLTV